MSIPILTTKLYTPALRRNFVSRPRLIQKLDQGVLGGLTLIAAPAGYGKTMLVVDWLSGWVGDVAWLSLDEDDNETARFFTYILATFASLLPALSPLRESLQSAPQIPPLESLVSALVNELAAHHEQVALVLDDYHLIRNPEIHKALSQVLERQPQHVQLVITTREDPALPLSRLRARGRLVEVREHDLRFTPEEAGEFLERTMGLTLSRQACADLTGRTEGWVAGLQMAGLSLQQRSDADAFSAAFRGDDRYVMDYLLDEVFRQQPQVIQQFLLRTSILERLCAELCEVVMADLAQEGQPPTEKTARPMDSGEQGGNRSQSILEYLEQANLFIVPLDQNRHWYRYHQLFSDLLRYRLERADPQAIPVLHRRVSLWWAQTGIPESAMQHAFASGDTSLAAELAEQFMLQMTGGSRLATFESWLQRLPPELIEQRAYLCAGCGWVYVLTSQASKAEEYLQVGEAALAAYEPVYSHADQRWISREEVQGNLYAIRSYASRLRGDTQAAIDHANLALEILPEAVLAVRSAVALNLGMLRMDQRQYPQAVENFNLAYEIAKKSKDNVYVAVSALSILGGMEAMQGKLDQANAYFQRAVQFARLEMGMNATIPAVGIVHGWLVWLHYQRNELAAAQEHMDQVLQSIGPFGQADTAARACLYQALLHVARGELPSAHARFVQAEEIFASQPVMPMVRAEWLGFKGLYYLEQGDLSALAHLYEAQGLLPSALETAPLDDGHLSCYVIWARMLMAQGKAPRAGSLLEKVRLRAAELPDFSLFLETMVFQALVALQRGQKASQELLEQALIQAAPEGFIQPFLQGGIALLKLLRQAVVRGVQPAFASRLMEALSEKERMRAAKGLGETSRLRREAAHGEEAQLPAELTAREKQVLRLLAAGLNSTQISEELVISVETARTYIKNLYQKLGVHNREEAIERGRQTGQL